MCRADLGLQVSLGSDDDENADDGECGEKEDDPDPEVHTSDDEFTTEHPDDAGKVGEEEDEEDEDGDYKEDGHDDGSSGNEDEDAMDEDDLEVLFLAAQGGAAVRRSSRTRTQRNLEKENAQVADWMES
jgi:hypothetical protein